MGVAGTDMDHEIQPSQGLEPRPAMIGSWKTYFSQWEIYSEGLCIN